MEWQLISDSSREGKMSSGAGGAYALEDVQDIMKRNSSSSFYDGKNDVTCGKSGGGDRERKAAIEAARSLGKCGKTAQEGGRERETEREKGKKMAALRIYEGFAFPLKNNARLVIATMQESISFISLSRDTNAPLEIIMQSNEKRVSRCTREYKASSSGTRLDRV